VVGLEGEEGDVGGEEAGTQVPLAREAANSADQLAEDLSKDMAAGLRVKPEDVATARVLAAQARASYNEALHHLILALADLERITGGGFCAHLGEGPLSRPAPAPEPAKDNKGAAPRPVGKR